MENKAYTSDELEESLEALKGHENKSGTSAAKSWESLVETEVNASSSIEDITQEDSITVSRLGAAKDVAKSQEILVKDEESPHGGLLYGISDTPPWYTCIILGLQHYLMMVESTVSIPYLLTPLMCMDESDPARASIACTIIFVSGIVTLLQTTFGVRLPIIQGGTHGFLGPILSILALMPCPSDEKLTAMTPSEREELWQMRMRTIQGSICVASVFQIVVGFSGMIGLLLRWITPLVIAPTVALIGFSLVSVAADKASSNWGIAVLTIFLLILSSQYLSNVAVPVISYTRENGFAVTRIYLFKLFPVIIAVALSWIVCWVLTAADVFSPKSKARTDSNSAILANSPWIRFPYPGQWGWPTATVAGTLGILAGVISSIIESIGDYYSCARLAGARPPPTNAINRGIFIEGIGTTMAGLWGTGSGTTSYSQNVGAIGVTKVGSRRVIQYGAGIMLLCGLIGKLGALFIMIPEPIIGGLFCVVFAMITSVGLSSIQYIDMNSSRNIFILGFSVFFGLALPQWMQKMENPILSPYPVVNQVLTVLLRTSMFVGGTLAFILDNSIPGTDKERGVTVWQSLLGSGDKDEESAAKFASAQGAGSPCYDLPFGMEAIKRWKWTRYIPVSPTFSGWRFRKRDSILQLLGLRK